MSGDDDQWASWIDMEEIHDGPSGALIGAVFVLGMCIFAVAFVLLAMTS